MALLRQRAVTTLPKLMQSLRKESPKSTTFHGMNRSLPSLRRAFSLYYQINLIDNVPEDHLRFQRYSETGFTVNGVEYEGSLLCACSCLGLPILFPKSLPESLSIFRVVRPIPEILILGCGKYIQPVNHELRNFVLPTGMKLDAVDSRNAVSTFNILNEEGRLVAAALLPYGVTS